MEDDHECGRELPLNGGSGLRVSWGLEHLFQLARAVFADQCVRSGLRQVRFQQVAGDAPVDVVEKLGSMLFGHEASGFSVRVVRLDGGELLLIEIRSGTIDLYAAAENDRLANRLMQRTIDAIEPPSTDPGLVPLTFWAGGPNGRVESVHRSIATSAWGEIAHNHGAGTRSRLDLLMVARGPGEGRLLLWHGPPGTGKTFALRALAREWRDWCIPHFISDPESLLGEGTGYLMRVLTGGDPEASLARSWRLVILEDAGELLAADARERTGQALSRLLNVTDGLLGQGMNALVLVTTNEPLGKLHPAVTRPGRCWMEIEFELLSPSEATAWLRQHGSEREVARPHTIADLYALLDGRRTRPDGRVFGFAAA